MKKYQHPVLFFTLSLVIPWVLWFVVAYWSHQPKAPNAFWTGFFELAGLLAPVGVAAYLFARDKALLSDLKARFIGNKLLSAISGLPSYFRLFRLLWHNSFPSI